jgi:hypothetical protein
VTRGAVARRAGAVVRSPARPFAALSPVAREPLSAAPARPFAALSPAAAAAADR